MQEKYLSAVLNFIINVMSRLKWALISGLYSQPLVSELCQPFLNSSPYNPLSVSRVLTFVEASLGSFTVGTLSRQKTIRADA